MVHGPQGCAPRGRTALVAMGTSERSQARSNKRLSTGAFGIPVAVGEERTGVSPSVAGAVARRCVNSTGGLCRGRTWTGLRVECSRSEYTSDILPPVRSAAGDLDPMASPPARRPRLLAVEPSRDAVDELRAATAASQPCHRGGQTCPPARPPTKARPAAARVFLPGRYRRRLV